MGVNVKVDGLMVLTGVAVAAGVFVYAKRAAIGQAINPASDQNLAYRSVNAVGSELTGDDDFSFGVWTWELLNPDRVQQEKDFFKPAVVDPSQGAM